MNKEQLAEKAKQYAGSVDEARWQLAELASRAKSEGEVEEWAEVIGHVVRRKPRTIYEWAQCADFRNALGVAISLPYSFYARAMRAVTKLKTEHLVELMDTAAVEAVTLEAFSALLDDLCKPPDEEKEPEDEPMAEPDLTPAQQWRAIAERLELQQEEHTDGIAAELAFAVDSLQRAASFWLQNRELAELDAEVDKTSVSSSMEDDLSDALEHAVHEINANGDGTMEASLYRHGQLVAGPGR